MTPEEEVRRGQWAQEARDNPLVSEALDTIERRITESWQNAPLLDLKQQQLLRQQLEASRMFRRFLEGTIKMGRVATEEIRQRTLLERAKDAMNRKFGGR